VGDRTLENLRLGVTGWISWSVRVSLHVFADITWSALDNCWK